MGVNCRLIACSRLRDSRARGIEKARTRKKGRRRGRGGAAHAFHFRIFPILSRLSFYLRGWNRLVDTRYIELKEEPKVKHLNWLTCNFASCRKRTQTSGSFICRFGLHWFRADYNVCHSKKLFLSSSIFMGSFNRYEVFIVPRLDEAIHYSKSKYSLFIFF